MKQGGNNFAFIDSQNLNVAIRLQGWVLDYRRFFIYLREKYHVRQAFLFFGYIAKNEPLYKFLKGCGYAIIFKPVLTYSKIKGNTDAEMVLHTMIEYDNFDQAIIVSGDGDFYCLVDYLNQKDKLGYLIIPDMHRYSGLLKSFAPNKMHYMNTLKSKLWYKKSRN